MRRFSLVFVALVWLWAPPATGEAARAYEQGLLWRIESPNAAPSYVFGTIHVSDARVQGLVRNMLRTVGRVDSVSLELVLTPELQAAITQRMLAAGGPPLSTRVGDRLFAQAAAAARPYGIDPGALERFKPWAIAVILSLPASELRAQADGYLNSEKMLEWFATNNGIALYAIEAIDEQIGPFDRLTETDQVDMLRVTLGYQHAMDDIFARLLNAYLSEDLSDVYRLMEEFSAGQQTNLQEFFEDELIAARNRRMVERIQPRLAEGNALIAVGALHLPDEAGILRLLERRGYTIVRMPALNAASPVR